MQDIGIYRKNILDQFYTKDKIARYCVELIKLNCDNYLKYIWVEPSAGNGVFMNCIPSNITNIAIDIEPHNTKIIQCDFLKWKPVSNSDNYLLFGNPPFGRQSSLAKKFIKHGSTFSSIIAFILPRSFVKPSMNNAFPLNFHCEYSKELPENSFEINGKDYNVPCVFQIWIKKDFNRIIHSPEIANGFSFVKSSEKYDIAFRRVGANAGKSFLADNTKNFNTQTHYFLKIDEKYIHKLNEIVDYINGIVFPSNTVGARSLSKPEAITEINASLIYVLKN